MTQYGTWVSYGGNARTWLAIALLAIAGGTTFAGIRLSLPAAGRRASQAGLVAMIVAWVASIVALLAVVDIYIRQYMNAYGLSAPAATPASPITPVTFTAVAVLFVVIVVITRGSGSWRMRLASGFLGAIAAPMIFELPFDLIVMPRSHPAVDPGLYRALLFGGLFAVEITTLLLLRLMPAARLGRATFFSFALMLGVFAVWALAGFGFPSAPLPAALNMASKILAFTTALTLFLPARCAGQSPRPGGAPGTTRPRPRHLAGAACGVLVVALAATGCSSAGGAADAPGAPSSGPVWLCQPGRAPDPCAGNLALSAVMPGGAVAPAARPTAPAASAFACFYLNPTSEVSQTRSGNAGLAVSPSETYIAGVLAAPFSQVCDVWSPQYQSQTLPTVAEGLAGNQALMRSTATVAYDSVLPAWRWFLARTGGKPIILIGDSQGATILIHLISAQLDHQAAVLRRLLVAILVGGNLQVPPGKTVGATFTKVPLCTAATETGCAIAFSSYPSEPPAGAVFGRPGQGTSLQAFETAAAGQQVACVNPAALGGGTGDLVPYIQTASEARALKQPVPTPWVTFPGLYSATCKQGGGATWLQLTSLARPGDTRPVVSDAHLGGLAAIDTGPAWGYHGSEFSLTLGNLLHDVTTEETAWQATH